MKKILFLLVMLVGLAANAVAAGKSNNDTIPANPSLVTRWITEPVVNEKTGKTTNKYYVIYNNTLVGTNKTTIDKVKLCQKYSVPARIFLIRKGNKLIRIIAE